MHLRLVSARLIRLLRLMRESGGHDYGRSIDLNSLNRQLITMIGRMGGLSSSALVAFTGHEKAQISRAVKALENMGLIERASLRAKLALRAPGEKIFQTIAAISLERDAALTVGISVEERNRFSSMTQSLTVRAAQIYAHERQLSAEAAAVGQGPPPPPIPSFDDMQDRAGMSQLMGSQLTALASYLRRSAMLAYQREQGLSNFQWMILSQIGEYEPLPLARLIEIMGRDKSQVGRTVAFFETSGLIERQRVARKRDIMVSTTPHGAEVYKTMCQIAIRRDEALTADFSAKQRAEYISLLERLEANARAMAAKHGEVVGV
ncbi:MAG: MarR family transcriptional regulator [Sphingobium sp.]|nr:MarR family transcriptional regulator [Sphingobium sp.]